MAFSTQRLQLLLLGALGLSWCLASDIPPIGGSGVEEASGFESLRERDVSSVVTESAETAGRDNPNPLDRHLRSPASPCGGEVPRGPVLERGGPPHLEVPDWNHGIRDSPKEGRDAEAQGEAAVGQQHEEQEKQETTRVEFASPFPPTTPWSPVSFSGYGSQQPMGPLLLACTLQANGSALCDVVSNKSYPQVKPELKTLVPRDIYGVRARA